MKFIIEQIALCPTNPQRAKFLLSEMGAVTWHEDHVKATGSVYGAIGRNEADLSFNYDLDPAGVKLELEVLHYTAGFDWMSEGSRRNSVSHLGMHCSHDALQLWKEFFFRRGIAIAQEVVTESHTNPVIAGLRRYTYCVFDTKAILGVDLKFIVRLTPEGAPY